MDGFQFVELLQANLQVCLLSYFICILNLKHIWIHNLKHIWFLTLCQFCNLILDKLCRSCSWRNSQLLKDELSTILVLRAEYSDLATSFHQHLNSHLMSHSRLQATKFLWPMATAFAPRSPRPVQGQSLCRCPAGGRKTNQTLIQILRHYIKPFLFWLFDWINAPMRADGSYGQ